MSIEAHNLAEESELMRLACEVEPSMMLLPSVAKRAYVHSVLAHVFRVRTYKQFVKDVRSLGDFDAKALRKRFIANGYVMKNLKLWLFWCTKHQLRGWDADSIAEEFGVLPYDVCLRRCLPQDLRIGLQRLASKYKALRVEGMDQAIEYAKREMKDWLGKFVYVRLRFAYKAEGDEAKDFENLLFNKSINGLMEMYPYIETRLHAINIMKNAARNYGNNLAEKYGSDHKNRYIRNADGTFSARVLPYDKVTTQVEAWLHEQAGVNNVADIQHDVRRVIGRCTGGKQRLLAILMGAEDKEFDAWLEQQRKSKLGSEHYQDRVGEQQFIKTAIQFIGVKEETGLRFIRRVAERLKEYQ